MRHLIAIFAAFLAAVLWLLWITRDAPLGTIGFDGIPGIEAKK